MLVLVADEDHCKGQQPTIYSAAYIYDSTRPGNVRWKDCLVDCLDIFIGFFRRASIDLLPNQRVLRERKSSVFERLSGLCAGGEEEEEEEEEEEG